MGWEVVMNVKLGGQVMVLVLIIPNLKCLLYFYVVLKNICFRH